jgi:hypothetical protein
MEKITGEARKIKEMSLLEIRKVGPKVWEECQNRIDRMIYHMLEVWKDVGKTCMKYIDMDEIRKMTASFYFFC